MHRLNLLGWALKNKLRMAVVNINVNYFRGFIVSDRLTVATRIDNIRVKSAFLLPENYT